MLLQQNRMSYCLFTTQMHRIPTTGPLLALDAHPTIVRRSPSRLADVPPSRARYAAPISHQSVLEGATTNGNFTNAALCTVTYGAAQRGSTVTIHAQGVHGTRGYDVFFEQSLIRIFSPSFVLPPVEPTGIIKV
jgi:hypothetical protein